MTPDFRQARWINPPRDHQIGPRRVLLRTEPGTDFWQRSYYGFRNDNAPALLLESSENFCFTARARFAYRHRFDQCGLLVYLDSENWFKASIEHEDGRIARLGSVVTNHGHSDWATRDIPATGEMWYRLSRRGPDFLIETAQDGRDFRQMRIFHLAALGETNPEAARLDPPPPPAGPPLPFGLYACSPEDSSFEARFDRLRLEPTRWRAHAP